MNTQTDQLLIANSRAHVDRILKSMRRLEAKGDEYGYAKALEAYKMWKNFDRRAHHQQQVEVDRARIVT